MRMALKLARKGGIRSSGQAVGGAVLVAGGKPVGYGYSDSAGGRPAALMALEEGGRAEQDTTLYTNIEPCLDCESPDEYLSRFLELAPTRVVIGHQSPDQSDSSSQVVSRLASSGITVEAGVCEEDCLQVNEVYYKYRRTRLPFVTVKFASSLDGRIATSTGDSQWISSPASLRFAHQLRGEHDAVLVGIGTVLADDPQLTVRLVEGPSPVRVIVDTTLRTPLDARVLLDCKNQHTIIATTESAELSRVRGFERLGAEVLVLQRAPRVDLAAEAGKGQPQPDNDDPKRYGVDLSRLLAALGGRGIASLLVEGDSGIITSLLASRSVERIVAVIAPKIIGSGIDAIGDLAIKQLKDAITFGSVRIGKLGRDIIFDGRIC
jgi:diaminohydroxyphosphoribosylaminopyrimidine deaminase/5-amino-6-(5-phosphoribosylamino)uracil reductase